MEPTARVLLARAKRQIGEFHRLLARMTSRLEHLEFEIDQLLADPRRSIGVVRRSAESARRMAAEAALGVQFVQVHSIATADGRHEVQIDHHRILLPPKLATLLEILASDPGGESAGWVAWKTRDEIWDALVKRFPPASAAAQPGLRRRHTIDNLISRLRGELEASGLHRSLIQTDRRRRAARLALHRRPSLVGG